jgi:hypothetical protein
MPDVPIPTNKPQASNLFARCYSGCQKYFWYGVALLVITVGTNAYQFYLTQRHLGAIEKQKGEILSQKVQIGELESSLETTEKRAAAKDAESQFAYSLGTYVARKFDDLDVILLKTDKNSLDFIDWMIQNAYFYGDVKAEANYRYGQWEAVQRETNAEYRTLKDEIDERLGTYEEPPVNNAPRT